MSSMHEHGRYDLSRPRCRDGEVMTKVLLEMTMSLDGYTAGPDVGPEEPLGRGGERLHDRMFKDRTRDVLEEVRRSGGRYE